MVSRLMGSMLIGKQLKGKRSSAPEKKDTWTPGEQARPHTRRPGWARQAQLRKRSLLHTLRRAKPLSK